MIIQPFLFRVFIFELLIRHTCLFILSPSIQITKSNIKLVSSLTKNIIFTRKLSHKEKKPINKISNYQSIRPTVRCQSQKYRYKLRKGRGFTLKELSNSRIDVNEAKIMKIPIDYRRNCYSDETYNANSLVLNQYVKLWKFNKKKEDKLKKQSSEKTENKNISNHNIKKEESYSNRKGTSIKEEIKEFKLKNRKILVNKNKREKKYIQKYVDRKLDKIRGFKY